MGGDDYKNVAWQVSEGVQIPLIIDNIFLRAYVPNLGDKAPSWMTGVTLHSHVHYEEIPVILMGLYPQTPETFCVFFFFLNLATSPRRSLRLALSDTRV